MQHTIRKEIGLSGIGLHTGKKVRMVLKPAPVNTGVRFVFKGVSIPATLENVYSSNREITLEKDGVEIHTVEHVLAAIRGLEVDNIIIEIDGQETPIGDGSSIPFVDIIKESGVISQNRKRRLIKLTQPFSIKDKDKYIIILPEERLRITYLISFNHPLVGTQVATFLINKKTFERDIAPSRTFGFLDEVEDLQNRGYALGGSLENAVVIGRDCILNEGLRFQDEFVRHKILDLIGDLFLLPGYIVGHIIAIKSGHSLNVKLLRKIKERDFAGNSANCLTGSRFFGMCDAEYYGDSKAFTA
ncbi:MAG: UDP-3-O-acyl-N-acetylglucosamine deacetylase [bacterium]|nr:UDP-3-O-acyl-N-acetylglucosamine deacetylase [bacterium]